MVSLASVAVAPARGRAQVAGAVAGLLGMAKEPARIHERVSGKWMERENMVSLS